MIALYITLWCLAIILLSLTLELVVEALENIWCMVCDLRDTILELINRRTKR